MPKTSITVSFTPSEYQTVKDALKDAMVLTAQEQSPTQQPLAASRNAARARQERYFALERSL